MQFIQKQEQAQKLHLTPSMRRSLECLQLSLPELLQYVQQAALENPMLEVELPSPGEVSLDASLPNEVSISERDAWDEYSFRRKNDTAEYDALASIPAARAESLRDHLLAQLGQTALIPVQLQPPCRFLIDCLDGRGYLDCPLEDLAEETGYPLPLLEQALFAIQLMDPPGVGARSLSECLILQLSQGPHFSALTLSLARDGLELLAKKQYSLLAKRFHTDKKSILSAAAVISGLNPIPSRGFGSHEPDLYVVPDAFITAQGDSLTIELNRRALPRVCVDSGYRSLLEASDNAELNAYLRQKMRDAEEIIRSIEGREQTLHRLMHYIVRQQQAFFLGGELRPMTMQSAAEALEISHSTVSRAVQDKYIQFGGRIMALRSLFSSAAANAPEGELSSAAIRQRLCAMIQQEDKLHPLSDEALAAALARDGVEISRRTVAKYRSQFQIPPASGRKSLSGQTS